MQTLVIVLAVAVALLYMKWIVIALTLPSMAAHSRYRKNRNNIVWKALAVPSALMERLMRGGWQRYVLFQIAWLPSLHARKAVYKALGATIAERVVFHVGTEIRAPQELRIGGGTIIGDNALLDARNGLTMGENVNLSSNVSIYTEQHNHRSPDFSCDFPGRKKSVEIDDRAWIGSNVTVLPGVHIGEGAVCCAGCVVTKDVAPYAVVAGIPAKKVADRPQVLTYVFNGKACRLY